MKDELQRLEGAKMIDHFFGWVSLVLCIVLLAKYLGRISNKKTLNQLLRKLHKPLGLAVLAIAALHGILCFVREPHEIVSHITGIIPWILMLCLALTFYARKNLKSKWLSTHRFLSIVLCITTVFHIFFA